MSGGGPRGLARLRAMVALCWPCCAIAQAPGPEPYEDRLMEGVSQAEWREDAGSADYIRTGWPRTVRIDYSLVEDRGTRRATTQGLSLYSSIDTPDHGSLSVDAALSTARDDGAAGGTSRAHYWRLDQRSLPLEGGWLADHAVGGIGTPQIPLAFTSARIYLPSSPLLGASMSWRRPEDLQFNASAGRFGLFSGQAAPEFDTRNGTVASAGVQKRLSPSVQAGMQAVQVNEVPDGGFGVTRRDTDALWNSISWEGPAPWHTGPAPARADGNLRIQGNVLHSRSRVGADDPIADAAGYWADASWRTAGMRQEAGAFRFDPALRWGPYVPAADLQGLYWRGDQSSRRWQLNASAEHARGVSDATRRSDFLSLAARYRVDTRNTVGGQVSARDGDGSGKAVQLSWDRLGAWGQTQWRAERAIAVARRAERLSVDQQWLTSGFRTLATALSWERNRSSDASRRILGWSLLGSQYLGGRLTWDASLRGQHSQDRDQIDANVGTAWQLSNHWSLLAQYTQSRGVDRQAPLLVSALTQASTQATAPVQSSRRFALTLRFEERAGTARAPIGGSPGSGAGSISGTLYFDSDGDGRQQAQETGVPGVTVLLDRRYAARTDAQGRYEFPWVAAGEHLIEVVPDNLPLPWSPARAEAERIRIQVRERTTFDFPLQRER